MTSKYLVNCAHGTDEPEKATIAFILAFTSAKTNETAIFATAGATELLVKNQRPWIQADGYEPLNELVDGYIQNGGKIWLCPACAKAKGVTEADLIEGVEIAGAPRTMAFLADGAKTLI